MRVKHNPPSDKKNKPNFELELEYPPQSTRPKNPVDHITFLHRVKAHSKALKSGTNWHVGRIICARWCPFAPVAPSGRWNTPERAQPAWNCSTGRNRIRPLDRNKFSQRRGPGRTAIWADLANTIAWCRRCSARRRDILARFCLARFWWKASERSGV